MKAMKKPMTTKKKVVKAPAKKAMMSSKTPMSKNSMPMMNSMPMAKNGMKVSKMKKGLCK